MDTEEEDDSLYCICRSTDVSRFMIGCDHCEEWYHGDCINVTARESKYIKKFFCKECRDKNPSLSVVYKSKYADKIQEITKQKEREERERKILKENKEKLGEKEEEKPKPKLPSIPKIPKKGDSSRKSDSSRHREEKEDVKVKTEHKEKSKDFKVKDGHKEKLKDVKVKDEHKDKIKEVKVKDELKEKTKEVKVKDESRDKIKDLVKVKDEHKEKIKEEVKKEEKKHKHKHKDDKEEKKHKHKHKHKEKDLEKEKDADKEKKKKHKHKKSTDDIEEDELAWLQSENTDMDIGVKRIPKDSSSEKVKEDVFLEKEKMKEKVREKKKQKEKEDKEIRKKVEADRKKEQEKSKEKSKEEIRKKVEADLKKKTEATDLRERSISTDSHSKSQDSHSEATRSPAAAPPKRPVLGERQQTKDTDDWQPSSSKPPKAPSKRKERESKDGHARPKKRRRDWRDLGQSSSEDEAGAEMDLKPRQCYGPQCTKCARVGSKYCSEQCGLSLASHRIYQTLPDRIREWNMKPCKAEENNRKELERIRAELQDVRQRLEERNREVDMLEAVIAKGRSLSVIEKDDSDDDEDEIRLGAIDCITCGKDIPVRTAIKHMESCFNKFESQTSFGSLYKTKIEGYQMFCDFYNQQAGTYCKRLRVICPEHTVDERVSDTAVCGFPLTKDIFSITGEFCRVAKRECNAHYCWEKLRRAELDMDRVRQWLKIDDLFEQERQEKEIISRRAGVLGLLLHSTFNHSTYNANQQRQQQAIMQQQAELRRQQVTGHGKTQTAKKV